MGKCGNVKQKPFRQIYAYSCIFRQIQTHLNTFRHNKTIQTYSGIIQTICSDIFWTLCNPGTYLYLEFRTLNPDIFRILVYSKPEAYSEPWYIENSGTFRTRGILRILAYSKPWDIYNRRHTQNFVKCLRWRALRNS